MKTGLHIGLGCLAVGLLAWVAVADPILYGIEPQTIAKVSQVRTIREEISLLNLLNGLYLSQEQLARLVPLAERAAAIQRGCAQEMAENTQTYLGELSTLRDALYTPIGSAPEQERRALEWEHKVELGPRHRAAEELGQLEDQARGVLTEGQLAIIEKFKPCLLPPKNLADPIAVGQASSTDKEEAMLDLVRRMPDYLYADRRSAIATAIIHHGEREKGTVPDDVRASLVSTYLAKMDSVRGMSNEDFALVRPELAKSFQLFDDAVTYRKGFIRESGSVGRFLLNAHAAEILSKWQVARANDPAESDLEAGPSINPLPVETQRIGAHLFRYGRLANALVEECSRAGRLDPAERAVLQKALLAAKDLSSAQDKFEAVDKVAARVMPLSANQTTVEAMFAKIACLCALKRIPPQLLRGRGPERPFVEAIGLGPSVEQARKTAQQGQRAEAYALLARVAQCLSDFRA